MRNPNRIFPMMNEVASLWMATFPDWRFSQLMMNFFAWLGHDPFYLEDKALLEKFKEFCEKVGEKNV